jgi:hypothetical protein
MRNFWKKGPKRASNGAFYREGEYFSGTLAFLRWRLDEISPILLHYGHIFKTYMRHARNKGLARGLGRGSARGLAKGLR